PYCALVETHMRHLSSGSGRHGASFLGTVPTTAWQYSRAARGRSTRLGELEVVGRIDGALVEAQLEVQGRTGGGARAAHGSQHVALPADVAEGHVVAGEVGVAGLAAVAVSERHGVAVRAPPPGPDYDPVPSGPDRSAAGGRQVDASVIAVAVDRDVAPAEARADPRPNGQRRDEALLR